MRHIKLKTKIPHPKDAKYITKLSELEPRGLSGQLPIVWDKAYDYYIFDRYGNRFLDFSSGVCVTNCGHGNTYTRNAIKYQIDRPLLYTYTFPHEQRYKLTKTLTKLTKLDKVFLLSTGTEATECACKLMRMYGKTISPKKNVILSFTDSMHGRTALAQQLKGKGDDWIGYKDPNIVNLPFPDITDTEFPAFLVNRYPKGRQYNDICGIIMESYQGWSSRFFPSQFMEGINKIMKSFEGLICFDDVQAGLGRTGKLFGYQHYDIKPDLVCLGKGLSGSLPLSAVIGKKKIMDLPEEGDMSSTHTANPLACAAGFSVLRQIKSVLSQVKHKENIVTNILMELPMSLQINGRGMVWSIITCDEEKATKITHECFRRGLITILTHRNSIKIAPPLTISDEALIEGLNLLCDVINENIFG